VILKDKQDIRILTNVLKPPVEGIFCDECRRAHKLAVVEDCSGHVACVNRG
jgi:hypothetical protein